MSEPVKVVMADPFRCRMWAYHCRLAESINEESCKSELASMSSYGQLIPVMARALKNDSLYDYELIYGARRLFVAQCLKVPLRLEVKDLTDRDCIIAIDIENQQRAQVSPYERGRCMKMWLSHGLFQTQDELAKGLKISASQVSRLIQLASLPAVLVAAFESPNQIREVWGMELLNAWRDPGMRQLMAQRARNVRRSGKHASAEEVFHMLTAEANTTPRRSKQSARSFRDDVVTSSSGEPLFMIRKQRGAVSLIIPNHISSPQKIALIREYVAEILQPASSQDVEYARFVGPRVRRDIRPPEGVGALEVASQQV